jgi:hypothetical protein
VVGQEIDAHHAAGVRDGAHLRVVERPSAEARRRGRGRRAGPCGSRWPGPWAIATCRDHRIASVPGRSACRQLRGRTRSRAATCQAASGRPKQPRAASLSWLCVG